MKNRNLLVIILVIIFLAIGGFYLYSKNQTRRSETKTAEPTSTEIVEDSPLETKEGEEPIEKKSEKEILMFGRSVMSGWFGYLGSNGSSPVKKENYILKYKEISSPPEIINSFKNRISKLSQEEKPIIFFKLCFVDFDGSSKSNAKVNFQRNKKYIEEIYEITNSRELKLIVGNALPQVPSYTTPYLKWNHKQYNDWLLVFQKEHREDFFVFDMYDVLSDSSGYLRARYTDDIYDSHPNEEAYESLTKSFFKFLEKNF